LRVQCRKVRKDSADKEKPSLADSDGFLRVLPAGMRLVESYRPTVKGEADTIDSEGDWLDPARSKFEKMPPT